VAAPSGWGWNQLDATWARRLVAEAGLPPRACVLDVGAGLGAITGPLLAAGAQVIAVERHPGRARELRRRFAGSVIVVQADAADLRLPRRPYHLVANPPFHVTSALRGRILQPGSRLVSATLVLQEQAARRWAGAQAPAVRRWGQAYSASLGPRVPRAAFVPPPPVDARVLRLHARRGRV
jgi:23S rRNA (adenine-N6)-dimethyltransferase